MLKFKAPDFIVKYFDDLTECNAHGQRLEEIADYCGDLAKVQGDKTAATIFYGLATDFRKINDRHDKEGSLSPELYGLRSYVRGRLIANMRLYYGIVATTVLNP